MTKPKVFAEDISSFSIVIDQQESSEELNRDLARISEWTYQWKMSFNPDPSKQTVEVYFTRRTAPASVPAISFNNTVIAGSEC